MKFWKKKKKVIMDATIRGYRFNDQSIEFQSLEQFLDHLKSVQPEYIDIKLEVYSISETAEKTIYHTNIELSE
ncbi:MAG: hypothetical protein ACFFD4_07855 [Candidatus Odinarchaeota archaeon]